MSSKQTLIEGYKQSIIRYCVKKMAKCFGAVSGIRLELNLPVKN